MGAGERVGRIAAPSIGGCDQPAILSFWYGESPSEIVAEAFPGGRVRYDSPAKEKPGMIRMDLDATGRLLTLEARPEQTAGPDKPATPDWNVLLDAAGLDAAHFSVATPQDVIPVMADARMAWTGTFGPDRMEKARVEAAALNGLPVYFRVAVDGHPQTAPARPQQRASEWVIMALWTTILVGAPLLARRNLLQGRSDPRGAARVATGLFAGYMCAWVCSRIMPACRTKRLFWFQV